MKMREREREKERGMVEKRESRRFDGNFADENINGKHFCI